MVPPFGSEETPETEQRTEEASQRTNQVPVMSGM
jgi:hypothetical protein